jgi:signal transduction histidine kinase
MAEALTSRVIVIDGEASLAEDYRYVLCGKRRHEDHPARLEESLFGATLEDERFPAIDLVTTHRPAEALEQLRRGLDQKTPFAVAFVDPYNLPGIDGADLLERIRALDPEVQIVVVTAESGTHPADLCERVAPADKLFFLHKPFHAFEIQQLTLALTAKSQRDRTQVGVDGLVRRGTGSEPELAAALELPPAAIMTFDQRDRLLAANSEMSRLFPELEDLLLPGTRYEEIQWQMAQRLLPDDTLYRVESWVRERLQWHRAGGGVLEQRLSAGRWVLLAEASSEGGETYCHFHDITELKQREISRANAARMTQMAQAFGALCERLYVGPGDLRQQQSGGKVVSLRGGHLAAGSGTNQLPGAAAGDLHGLMGKLQAIAQRLRLSPESLELNHEIAEAMREMGELVPPAVSVEVIGGAGIWNVLVDRERLHLVLIELIKNACEAMEGEGQLTVETSNVRLSRDFVATRPRLAAGDYVRLSIEDNGPGMSPELAERAFNPFFTSKSSRRHVGLGLSMAHGFMNQSGGHIEIRDGTAEGTEIDVYFPRAQRASKPSAETDTQISKSSE